MCAVGLVWNGFNFTEQHVAGLEQYNVYTVTGVTSVKTVISSDNRRNYP